MKDLFIRGIIALAVLSIPFLEKTDIDKLIYIFPIAYLFSVYFIKDLSKYLLVFTDIIFFLFVIYITYNPILAIFFFPLFVSYIEEKKHTFTFLFAGLITSLYSFYVSEYVEFSSLLFWLPASTSIVLITGFITKLKADLKQKEDEISQKINEISKLKEKIYPIKIESLDRISFEDKKKSIFLLNQILNTSSVAYFDINSQKCIYTQEEVCDKEILKYVNDDFGKIETDKGTVIFIVEYSNKTPTGVYFFFYEDEKVEDNIYNFIFLKEKLNN
ncbi:MAG: hypothetical protein DSY47_00805 [Hydrogenothermus sp.]|nr:MAG: hypothetical protein DSY47_00805 [Hydrogenothermus sp.]